MRPCRWGGQGIDDESRWTMVAIRVTSVRRMEVPMNPSIKPPRHYPTPAAKCADLVVHVVGLTLALVGGIVLLTFAVSAGSISLVVGVSIYAAGVVMMLAFSTAYNFAHHSY